LLPWGIKQLLSLAWNQRKLLFTESFLQVQENCWRHDSFLFAISALLLIPSFRPFSSQRGICSLSVFNIFKSLSIWQWLNAKSFMTKAHKKQWSFHYYSHFISKRYWIILKCEVLLEQSHSGLPGTRRANLFYVFSHSPRLVSQDGIFLFSMIWGHITSSRLRS